MTFLQTFCCRTATQIHKEYVHDSRANHKERAHRTRNAQRFLFVYKAVGNVYERGKKYGEEHQYEVVPKVLSKTFRAPNEEEYEEPADTHHIGNPHIEPDVLFDEHSCKNQHARHDCKYVGNERQEVVSRTPHHKHKQ